MMTGDANKGLTRLLLDHYAGPNTANLIYLGYEFKNKEYREYPLVTPEYFVPSAIKVEKISCSFLDGQPFHYGISSKDPIAAHRYWGIVGLSIWDSPIYSLYKIGQDFSRVEFISCSYADLRFKAYRSSFGSLSDELAQSLARYGINGLRKRWKRLNRYWPKKK